MPTGLSFTFTLISDTSAQEVISIPIPVVEFDALVSSSPNKVTLLSSPPVSLSTGATFIDVADVEVL